MCRLTNSGNNRWKMITFGLGLAVAASVQIAPPVEAEETAICSMEVLVDGVPLKEFRRRGTTYIEALREREYAVRLRNNTARRVAVALAVDGLNSIDAKTTPSRTASKWVLGPYETVTISGWQTSNTSARRFFFTTEDQSYGEWLGRTANLGVIEAVVYRERVPTPVPDPIPFSRDETRRKRSTAAPRAAERESAGEALMDDLAATGIGRHIDHRVRRVHLNLESQPATRLRIRYEYRRQLVYLGVLPSLEEERALERRESAHGFTNFDFAPVPDSVRR